MIIFFRGKAATGKTSASHDLKSKHHFSIISKDIVFDELLKRGNDWATANAMAYDALAYDIQRAHDLNEELIVDIGLAHTPYFINFLSKMCLDEMRVKKILFICSDEDLWRERIESRIKAPEAPNQGFKSFEEAKCHYQNYEIVKLDDEIVIDSAMPFESMYKCIIGALK